MEFWVDRICPVWKPSESGGSDAGNSEAGAPIKVGVTHGDLGYSKYPLAVGHYEFDVVRGPEEVLNRRLNGRLEELRDMGLYAGPLQTVRLALDENARPPGAVIVGLGGIGELLPGHLTATFAHAALSYAVHIAESREAPDGKTELGISTLLLGTRDSGISIKDSIKGVLEGLLQAQETLRLSAPEEQVRFNELEFIEVRRDRANQAAHVLQEILRVSEWQSHFAFKGILRKPGGKAWIPGTKDRDWWNRLQIREDPHQKLLVFSSPTRRARVEERLMPSSRKIVDSLLETAVSTTDWNEKLANSLFQLLLPNELKPDALAGPRVILQVDGRAARYPWELLNSGSSLGSEPLGVRTGIIRQLSTPIFRRNVVSSAERRILIVGDSITDFDPLPGAEMEANLVKQLFEGNFQVVDKIQETAEEIVPALYDKEYKIVHLAGHGAYRWRGMKQNTGMVLDGGKFLTPSEIEQMSRVPELVFVNCCHLGYIDQRDAKDIVPNYFAANVAWQLIRMGVRAVISSGWAVDDDAALTFADEFYRKMLDQETFGEAVCAARAKTWKNHPRCNTYGAYQCYGDPDYVLARRKNGFHSVSDFVDVGEVASLIDDLTQEARNGAYTAPDRIRSRAEAILANVKEPSWFSDAELLEPLGRLYGELDDFERAVDYYERALRSERATASLESAEQRANLQVRLAVKLASGKEDKKTEAITVIEKAMADLTRLLEVGKTAERLSLLASAYKRLAQVDPKQRLSALEKMVQYYESAHRLNCDGGKVDHYPLLNWLLGRVLLDLVTGNERNRRRAFRGEIEHGIENAKEAARRTESEEADWWSGTAKASAALTRHLVLGTLETHVDDIFEIYLGAWKRGGSRREFDSAIENIGCIIEIFSDGAEAPHEDERKAACEALVKLQERLEEAREPLPPDTPPAKSDQD